MAVDPVCRMEVQEGRICSTYGGKKYCFCSEMCKAKFDKEPSIYVEEEGEKER